MGSGDLAGNKGARELELEVVRLISVYDALRKDGKDSNQAYCQMLDAIAHLPAMQHDKIARDVDSSRRAIGG